MRGFAVAAGGWDDETTGDAGLQLVEPAEATPGETPEPAAVVDLDAHRRRRDAAPAGADTEHRDDAVDGGLPALDPAGVIYAW